MMSVMSDTPRPARTTMADVAQRAGVSVMTVSNVINGHDERVGDETRSRVLEAIAELSYQVNVTARHLRKGHTGVVALAVPDFAHAYYGELATRLADRLAAVNLRLVLERTSGSLNDELAILDQSRLSAYDGLILSLTAATAADVEALHRTKPVIALGERAMSPHMDHVAMDNEGGARMATLHLLDRGARRIAVVGGTLSADKSMSSSRTRGYLSALEERSIAADPELIVGGPVDMSGGHQAAAALLDGAIEVDGILALTDAAAIGALSALAARGRRVPQEVQVIGWDDTDASRFTVPGLTSVDPDNARLADEVVRILLNRMGHGTPKDAEQVVPPARLATRGTTRPEA